MDITTVLVFVTVFLIVHIFLSKNKRTNLPPCPPNRLPIIGHLLLMTKPDRLETFHRLRQKYGDIYRLEIGSKTVIVISGYRLLHTAFIKNADIFSDRPHTVFLELCKDNGILLNNGDRWKDQRNFVLKNFRFFTTRTTILETIIHKKIHHFLDNIASLAGAAVEPKILLNDALSSVVGEMMFGEAIDTNTDEFRTYVKNHDEIVHRTANAVILDFLPFLRYFPLDLVSHDKVVEGYLKTTNFVREKIGMRRKMAIGTGEARDLMEAYIKRTGLSESGAEEQAVQVVSDMFAAGLETTVSTLRWALLYLIRYPDIQTRLQQEIDQAIPEDRLPSMADKKSLPFTEAFVMELLRHSDVAPIGLLHSVSENTYLDGYFIPKGATVIPNIDSVLKDPTSFENPYEFNPARFLNNEGKVFKPETFIPFFFGKRLCMGEQIARMNLMLFMTSLLQMFSVKRPEGDNRPIGAALKITYCPNSFEVCFHKRKNTH